MAIYELHLRDFSIGDASVPAAAPRQVPRVHRRRQRRHAPPARAGAGRPDRRAPAAGVRPGERARARLHARRRIARRPGRRDAAGGRGRRRGRPTASTGATTRSTTTRPKAATRPTPTTARCACASSARMVQAPAPRPGLRVGMDVVYNHTRRQRPVRATRCSIASCPATTTGSTRNGASSYSTVLRQHRHREPDDGQAAVDSVVAVGARSTTSTRSASTSWATQPRAVMEALQTPPRRRASGRDDRADRRRLELRRGGQRRALRAGVAAVDLERHRHRHLQRPHRATPCAAAAAATPTAALIANQGWINGAVLRPERHRPRPDARRPAVTPADLIKRRPGGLAPRLHADHQLATARRCRSSRSAYGGQPAGYAARPAEAVNYVENHDNQTLFDNNVLQAAAGHLARRPGARADPRRRDRRVQPGRGVLPRGRRPAAHEVASTRTASTRATGSTASTGATPTTASAPACRRRPSNARLWADAAARCWPTRRSSRRPPTSPGRATRSATCCASARSTPLFHLATAAERARARQLPGQRPDAGAHA